MIMQSTTGKEHHEPMNHTCITSTGTTSLAQPAFHKSRPTRHQQKRDADHAPQPPNELRISRRERVESHSKIARISRAKRSAACACSAAAERRYPFRDCKKSIVMRPLEVKSHSR